MKFAYQSEKFSEARSALMLPHPQGESQSIASAFHSCSLALHDLDRESLDESARSWVREIETFTNTTGLVDPNERGLWAVKADSLNEDQKFELSHLIDELAHYFEREFWSSNSELGT